MVAFRIADRRRTIFDGTGSFLFGNRWNSPGKRVIYAAQTYAGALLETLIHAEIGRVPRNHVWIEIGIPDDIDIETVSRDQVPGWSGPHRQATQEFGDQWFDEQRTVILRVPSVVTSGIEHNFLLNQEHPQFSRLRASTPEAVVWDPRLF
jgi:RES domain-containing protein